MRIFKPKSTIEKNSNFGSKQLRRSWLLSSRPARRLTESTRERDG